MIEINPSAWRTKPFAHQIAAVKAVCANRNWALFDECGIGKSKETIDAACELFRNEYLDLVVVVAPSSVKSAWTESDPENLGQLATHAWVPVKVAELVDGKLKQLWNTVKKGEKYLPWLITAYEYIRQYDDERKEFPKVEELMAVARGYRFLLVYDESSFLRNRTSLQTRAARRLSMSANRVVILNGTPNPNGPMDLYAQFDVLDPRVVEHRKINERIHTRVIRPGFWSPFRNFYHFRSRYAEMGGWNQKQIIKYHNLEELKARVATRSLRRLKKDCLDLPPKIMMPPAQVALGEEAWKHYVSMRDEAVVILEKENAQTLAGVAGVAMLRLAQITSGFIGGLIDERGVPLEPSSLREISSEKRDWLADQLADLYGETPNSRVLIWCRFIFERERFVEALEKALDGAVRIDQIMGGQPKTQRREAEAYFMRNEEGPALIVGNPAAGGFGLNLQRATYVYRLSQDYNLLTRQQSDDRTHRQGLTHALPYQVIFATGPRGQKTSDHVIERKLSIKEEFADWDSHRWAAELRQDMLF